MKKQTNENKWKWKQNEKANKCKHISLQHQKQAAILPGVIYDILKADQGTYKLRSCLQAKHPTPTLLVVLTVI